MQQEEQLSAESLSATVRFPDEHGIVLDKWIYDVCGDDEMQFPLHRRAQLPAYMQRCRSVKQQKAFLAGTFAYPSRSGTREVLVLQQMLDALGARERLSLRGVQKLEANIQQVRAVLAEKTMGASELPAGNGDMASAMSSMVARPDVQEGGYAQLGGEGSSSPEVTGPDMHTNNNLNNSADASADYNVRETRREQYEQKRSIAERYRGELQRKTAEMAAKLPDMQAQHEKLMNEKLQLDKEHKALEMTEEIVVGRHEETAAKLKEESDALEAERSAVAALTEMEGGGYGAREDMGSGGDQQRRHHDDDSSSDGQRHSAAPTTLTLAPSVALSPEAQARQATLEKLRAELSEAGATLMELKRQLVNGEQIHAGRFKLSRQRLKDWQDMVAGLRRTHHQLKGQVDVIGVVVQDTAQRLAAASAAAERSGYLNQIYRLNSLLAERTSETLHAYLSNASTVGSPTALQYAEAHGVSAFTADVRPLARPAPTPIRGGSTVATPIRGGGANSNGGSWTPTVESPFATPQRGTNMAAESSRAGSAGAVDGIIASYGNGNGSGPQVLKHRSRYDVVRHLQRWELALQAERAQLLEAAGLSVSDRTTGENVRVEEASNNSATTPEARTAHMRQRFLKLRKLLLQDKP